MADFFKDLGKNSDKYLSDIEDKIYEFADNTGTRIDIMHFKSQKDRELKELGNKVYRMHLKDKFDEDDIKKDCIRILEIDNKIKSIEGEADEKKKARKTKK